MCGRYRLSRRKQLIEEYFETAPWDDDWNPRYNIAPTQPVPVIRQHPKEPVRQISLPTTPPQWSRYPICHNSCPCRTKGGCIVRIHRLRTESLASHRIRAWQQLFADGCPSRVSCRRASLQATPPGSFEIERESIARSEPDCCESKQKFPNSLVTRCSKYGFTSCE